MLLLLTHMNYLQKYNQVSVIFLRSINKFSVLLRNNSFCRTILGIKSTYQRKRMSERAKERKSEKANERKSEKAKERKSERAKEQKRENAKERKCKRGFSEFSSLNQ